MNTLYTHLSVSQWANGSQCTSLAPGVSAVLQFKRSSDAALILRPDAVRWKLSTSFLAFYGKANTSCGRPLFRAHAL